MHYLFYSYKFDSDDVGCHWAENVSTYSENNMESIEDRVDMKHFMGVSVSKILIV